MFSTGQYRSTEKGYVEIEILLKFLYAFLSILDHFQEIKKSKKGSLITKLLEGGGRP